MSIFQSFLNLLFPARCHLCRQLLPAEEAGKGLCLSCWDKVSWLKHCCPRCAMPLEGQFCTWCQGKSFAFQKAYALARYQGEWRRLLHRLKYGREGHIAHYLGSLMAEMMDSKMPAVSVIVPVPLHDKREKERGFNQSLLLARAMGRKLGLPCQELLIRVADTCSQTGLKRSQREKNVQGAFAVKEGQAIPRGLPLLLVDDVMTTGATANEASRILRQAGAGEIVVAVAAR
ncbi:MAG: ComF family protein [Firmicutes bacterium]|nr:ComF family protein [Bacillota bacterium]